jgi:hypothetical protein
MVSALYSFFFDLKILLNLFGTREIPLIIRFKVISLLLTGLAVVLEMSLTLRMPVGRSYGLSKTLLEVTIYDEKRNGT